MSRRRAWIPILDVLRGYRLAWLRPDLMAGVSVCVVMIPSVIAYAELAGLEPEHGLYAALAGMVGYALFCSARRIVAGPDAAISLLVGTAISPLVAGDPARAASLAALTAVLGGVIMLASAALRLGAIADFLSKPVLVGYMSGAALILVSTQLGNLFGIRLVAHGFFPLLTELGTRLGETHWPTFALGAALIALLEVLRRFAPRAPGALIVCVLAVLASFVFDLESHGVRVVGAVVPGLPRIALPATSIDDISTLLPSALAIAMLTMPDGLLLARAFATKHREEIRPNQECTALAAANLAAGLFQGFSVGASQSRSTISDATGGKTQVVNLFAAVFLGGFLFLLTPILRVLPTVALAASLVSAGIHLVEVRDYRTFLRVSPRAALVAFAVLGGVLIVGVIPGILIGVGLSLVYVLGRLARPSDAVLHEVPGTGRFHDVGDSPEPNTVPGLIAYRFYSPLFFANAEHFVHRIRSLVDGSPQPIKWVLVDVQAVSEIDVTGAEAVERLAEELAARGIALKFARANRPLREKLERIGLGAHIRGEQLFHSVHAGIAAFQRAEAAAAGTAAGNPPGVPDIGARP